MDRLRDKTALITGAARGIGGKIAQRFSEEGAHVIINDINLEAAREMADQIGGSAIACDVSDSLAVDEMFEQVEQQFENLDILVNNAGISGLEDDSVAHDRLLAAYAENSNETKIPILEVTDEAWGKMLAVHLNGTFFCSRAALRIMINQKGRNVGRSNIINMGSIMGTAGGAGAIAYCSAKAGILGLTRSLARELAPHKIRVNALAPGHIYTDMISSLEDMHPSLVAQTPMGHLGETDDIAWAAVYLASDEAKFVTGQTLSPNGGWHMSQ